MESSMKYFLLMFLVFFSSCEKKVETIEKIKTLSFREFLKQNQLSLDFNEKNEYESLLPENKYSNHYFNFSTVLPGDFEIDRGNFQNTIIRGFDSQSGVSISIGVTPISSLLDSNKVQTTHKRFQESPLNYMNEIYNGDFKGRMLETLRSNSNLKIKELSVGEKKIRSTNYVYIMSEYIETYDDNEVEMIKVDYQTILWGNSFGFSYNTPKSLYEESLILEVLNHTNYIKP